MIIGYARVSTRTQSVEPQIKLLKEYGCDIIYDEMISGCYTSTSKLELEIIPSLKEGDKLVVVKFDRLGRSIKHFINLIEDLKVKRIKIKSLQENIDSDSAFGSFMMMMIAHMNAWERQWISERTKHALSIVRDRQGFLGRKRGTLNANTLRNRKLAYHMRYEQKMSIDDMAIFFKVSKSSINTWLWTERKIRKLEENKV